MRLGRLSILFASCVGLGYAVISPPKASPKPRPKIDYNRDIRPILSEKCFNCHGHDPKAVQAGLNLDGRATAIARLASGHFAIVPGKPNKGELIARISAPTPEMRMPPPGSNKPAVTAEERALLRQWIEEGAVYKPHWAFVAPVRPELPPVKQKSWPRNPIDFFVLAELERRGLSPSPAADRSALLRRVSLDLTGLPPTIEEQNAFLTDPSPKAYDKVVDRLLASPAYGERMAMDWMDYARYADSNGYQADYERYQWRWRDWVIDAYNQNMPYDRFTVEQLAGDMLPNATVAQRIATGFNRNHRINTEGGVISEEWRVENVIDRVETTSTVWLGLTTGCARCHDHKYDPIKQREFYSLFAYFNNVPESGSGEERPVNHPPLISAPTPEQEVALKAATEKRVEAEARVRAMLLANEPASSGWKIEGDGAPASLNEGVSVHYAFRNPPVVVAGTGSATISGQPKFESEASRDSVILGGDNYLDLGSAGDFEKDQPFSFALWINPDGDGGAPLSRMDTPRDYRGWDLYLLSGKPAVHMISTWPDDAMKVNSKSSLPKGRWTHVAVTYDGSAKPAGLKIYLNGKLSEMETEKDNLKGSLRTTVSAKVGRRTNSDQFYGKVADLSFYSRALSAQEAQSLAGVNLAKALLAVPAANRTEAQRRELSQLWSQDHDPAFREADIRLKLATDAENMAQSAISSVMVMEEMPKPRTAFMLIRGLYDKRGPVVYPRLPAALPPLPKGAPNNRLGLAKWIVDPSNPLTARVTVNRFWERLFGIGIVATSEDFGTRAEFPSHPELLDWLATEFIRTGWDQKAMLRTIVTSATYRQSSRVTPALLAIDPQNRLLARGPRFRLPAEVIRDQALFAAGELVQKIGGPSVRPYQPEGIWDETNVYGNLRNYKHDPGEGRYRRSLYTIWKRTAAPPDMTLFDSSTRETCRVRRARTNTPLQALTLLNDVTYVEASRAIAQRAMREYPDASNRLRAIFRRLAGRPPTQAESAILGRGFDKRLATFRARPETARKFLKTGDLPADPAIEPAELAAYALVASTVLNLDETVTKE